MQFFNRILHLKAVQIIFLWHKKSVCNDMDKHIGKWMSFFRWQQLTKQKKDKTKQNRTKNKQTQTKQTKAKKKKKQQQPQQEEQTIKIIAFPLCFKQMQFISPI